MSIELDSGRAAVVVIDFQERLCAAMPPAVVALNAENTRRMLTLATALGLPVVVSEQYPKGLGATLPALSEIAHSPALPKTMFSAFRDPDLKSALEATGRDQFILAGMETHICVYQTARDLVRAGFEVVVPEDMVVSRSRSNWQRGLKLMAENGVQISAAEAVFFDLLKEGRGDAFKTVSRMIR